MSDFSKTLCKIAIPVTLQCMLQSSFSIVDQLMIGQLGEASIAAVGLGSNFSLIYEVMAGAIATVSGIIISQFLGADDKKEAFRGFNVSLIASLIVALIFCIVANTATTGILSLYTDDAAIVSSGSPYFRIVAISYIPIAINMILSSWLRCREHATLPLIATFGSVIINTGLNYLLIFGKFGFRSYGVKGAALATLISAFANTICVFIGFCHSMYKDKDKYFPSFKLQKISIKEYFIMIGPILISEFLWSLGQNVESGVYGHLSTASLAAYTLTCPIQGLVCGALSGLSAAAGVMIGKRLGAKEYELAYTDSRKIMWAGLIGSVLLGLVLVISAGFYVSFYNVEQEVRSLGRLLLIVFAIYSPVKVENMILGGGIIKSGGDTKTVMIIDIIGTWLVGVPLCFLTAYVFKMQIVGVYAIFTFEEVVRLVISLLVFKSKKWMISLS